MCNLKSLGLPKLSLDVKRQIVSMRVFTQTITAAALAFILVPIVSAQEELAEDVSALSAIVSEATGKPVRHYMTYDFGRAKSTQALSIIVGEDAALELAAQIRSELEEGYTAFIGTTLWLGDEAYPGEVEIVVAPIEEKWDILRLARTDAVNHDMTTQNVIDWLAKHDSMLHLDIWQANTDTVFATLGSMPADIDSFLNELYDFCPDIVDQGTGSVKGLREMMDAKVLYLWWD